MQTKQQGKGSYKLHDATVNLLAGGIGGTVGVFLTLPFDVVQTRFQSSIIKKSKPTTPFAFLNTALVKNGGSTTIGINKFQPSQPLLNAAVTNSSGATTSIEVSSSRFGLQVFSYLRQIVRTEGVPGLYKGLVPNLVGIAPSRALYFAIYNKTKHYLSNNTHLSQKHSSWTHFLSALSASLTVSTVTNPIWFLKTRLQLDITECGKRRGLSEVIKEEWKSNGIRGFYRGLSASYVGASETVVYFVIYERIKQILASEKGENKQMDYVCASLVAKMIATTSCYPHEVVRTRLRQDRASQQKLYHGFLQTLKKVYREEGWVGLYGGMGAHIMRQVPNTVVMFCTYEFIRKYLSSGD